MAEKNKGKMVEAITPMSEDFTQWYTDVVLRAELIDYASVRGCMILRPYGYAIWAASMGEGKEGATAVSTGSSSLTPLASALAIISLQ